MICFDQGIETFELAQIFRDRLSLVGFTLVTSNGEEEKLWILECGQSVRRSAGFGSQHQCFDCSGISGGLSLSLSYFFAFQCIACEQKWHEKPNSNPETTFVIPLHSKEENLHADDFQKFPMSTDKVCRNLITTSVKAWQFLRVKIKMRGNICWERFFFTTCLYGL